MTSIALSNSTKRLRINPKDHRAHHNLGFVQMLSGQHQAAEKSFKKAIDLDSNHSPSYSKLGDIFSDRNDIEQAIHYYQEGFMVQPTSLPEPIWGLL